MAFGRTSRFTVVLMLFSFAVVGTVLAGDISGAAAADVVAVWIDGDHLPKQPAPRRVTVSQRGVKFDPDFLIVRVGQAVVMPNDDSVAHNVYSLSETKKFNLGMYGEGDSRSVTFDKPGIVPIRCYLHQRMNATIVVVPNRFYSSVTNGRFRIGAVPAGTYRIVAARKDRPEVVRTVTVPPSGSIVVDF